LPVFFFFLILHSHPVLKIKKRRHYVIINIIIDNNNVMEASTISSRPYGGTQGNASTLLWNCRCLFWTNNIHDPILSLVRRECQ
jgi:hypothetical protein